MKRAALVLILAALMATLSANPVVVTSGLLGVWFDADGDFWMAYEPIQYAPQAFEDMHEMAIYTDSGAYQLPEDWVQTYIGGGYICHVNLSEEIPGFAVNRQADTFSLLNVPYPSSLTWGGGSGYDVDLRPLTGEQAAMSAPFEVGEFGDYLVWAKSASYQDLYADSNRRCKVGVSIRDDAGHTVQNFPIRQFFGNPSAGLNWTHYTDSSGNLQFNYSYAIRYLFRVEDPLSGEIYAEHLLYPEPGDSLWVQTVIPCPHTQQNIPGVLELRPNLLNRNSSGHIRVLYDKYWALGPDARVALYDLRGRELLSVVFPFSGQLDWLLPDLPNGIYFIGLSASGKRLARQRLTVIK